MVVRKETQSTPTFLKETWTQNRPVRITRSWPLARIECGLGTRSELDRPLVPLVRT